MDRGTKLGIVGAIGIGIIMAIGPKALLEANNILAIPSMILWMIVAVAFGLTVSYCVVGGLYLALRHPLAWFMRQSGFAKMWIGIGVFTVAIMLPEII